MYANYPSSATSLDRGNSAGSYKSPVETVSYLPNPYNTTTHPSTLNSQPQTSSGSRRPTEMERLAERLEAIKVPLELHKHQEADDEIEWMEDESEGEDDSRFVNFSLLSHIAVRLKDRVPRGTHVKGSIPYPRAFTGKDIVVSLCSAFFLIVLA